MKGDAMGSSTTSNPERVAWNAAVRSYERTGMAWDWPTLALCHPVLAAVMDRLGMVPECCKHQR